MITHTERLFRQLHELLEGLVVGENKRQHSIHKRHGLQGLTWWSDHGRTYLVAQLRRTHMVVQMVMDSRDSHDEVVTGDSPGGT